MVKKSRSLLKTQQARLLYVLWDKEGSKSETGRVIGVSRAQLNVWVDREGLPLIAVGPVARALKIPLYALNYKDVCIFMGHEPSWTAILKDCHLTSDEMRYVLKGEPPV